jgi:hypothetical protein
MDPADINKFGTEAAGEVAVPLIDEIGERLGLDLLADDKIRLRILVDFANRVFSAGYTFGVTETTARFVEGLPPNSVNVQFDSPPEPNYAGPLGEGSEWNLDP